ncbi:enoyl-CoA hydratase-related protein [Actinomadura algeriensis]|uniref:2-(1,2-epoxy-1,2-dihydrophenyl)acetyl-CoA isomerase n=1 Tax=Actinomadura algeriensis TaxID=1679523 RepID=A0ABR9JUT4_9ACTN|nr:enoyl-CoA hydratase-related protein [Actinomadura algeriensis]MBE1534320.1 2-(1,2-epoxy-1,2-dihydrophenyl)acetyl-CoA isomerase [Actinomadura algeriensis]
MSDTVLYDVTDAVATITLNRPDGMNSLTSEMKDALRGAVERAASDGSARAVILTGAGRAFCAGQDLREHADNLAAGRDLNDTVRKQYNPIVLGIANMGKPVVAAVNGVAAGAGASLALACDLIVASDRSRFATAFTGIGLAPDSGMSWTLPRLVGRAKAAELLLLGEPLKAAEALELGLVNRVVPADELAPASVELARRLAAGPTAAYAAVKAALDHAATNDLASALAKEADLQDEAVRTSDHRGATEAFLKKEQPAFEGR